MADKQELQRTSGLVPLNELEPATLARSLRSVRSVKDALTLVESNRDKYPSLAVLRRDYGSEAIEDIIMLYLDDLRNNVNLTRPLRDAQIELIAREIVVEYYSLTIADIHIIFRQAKTGAYGDFFGSLDMPKVMSWFRDYFDDRSLLAAHENIYNGFKESRYQSASTQSATSEQLDAYKSKLVNQFNKNKK